jgi:hypothetical protein
MSSHFSMHTTIGYINAKAVSHIIDPLFEASCSDNNMINPGLHVFLVTKRCLVR